MKYYIHMLLILSSVTTWAKLPEAQSESNRYQVLSIKRNEDIISFQACTTTDLSSCINLGNKENYNLNELNLLKVQASLQKNLGALVGPPAVVGGLVFSPATMGGSLVISALGGIFSIMSYEAKVRESVLKFSLKDQSSGDKSYSANQGATLELIKDLDLTLQRINYIELHN